MTWKPIEIEGKRFEIKEFARERQVIIRDLKDRRVAFGPFSFGRAVHLAAKYASGKLPNSRYSSIENYKQWLEQEMSDVAE